MIKKYVLGLLFIFVFFAAPCWAAPGYGTELPEKRRFIIGGQTHYVGERELEDDNGSISSLQHFLMISYGVTDRFSVDLKGGAGDTHHKPDGGDQISYPAYLAGGYGFRFKFFDQEKVKAVFGFQHISVHPYSVFIGNVKHKAVIDDWQLSFLVSREWDHVTPYLGGKWSRMDYIHWVEDDRNRVKSDLNDIFGLVIGADIPVREKMWLTLEGQFLDVRAFSASVQYQF